MDSTVNTAPSKPRLQFGLKHLLLAMAVVALLLTPARWLGTGYLIAAMLSLGFVLATVYAYHRGGYKVACAVAFGCGGFAFITFLWAPVYTLHAIANFFGAVALGAMALRTSRYAFCLLLILLGVYGWAMWDGYDQIAELQRLREENPIVSLASRLEFEETAKDESPEVTLALSQDAIANLANYEGLKERRSWRALSLRTLHESLERQFALAAGFGISRMGTVRERMIAYQEESDSALPLPVSKELELPYFLKYPEVPSTTFKTPESVVHAVALTQFASSETDGYVAGPQQAAGFLSHRFGGLRKNLAGSRGGAVKWQLTRLELVSLLRHKQPRVYQSNRLPQMDELAGLSTRELNEFEAAALPQLRTEEDVVIEEHDGAIVMLGSVRAASSCLECHDAQRGQLLGAFSYELVPVAGTRTTK